MFSLAALGQKFGFVSKARGTDRRIWQRPTYITLGCSKETCLTSLFVLGEVDERERQIWAKESWAELPTCAANKLVQTNYRVQRINPS